MQLVIRRLHAVPRLFSYLRFMLVTTKAIVLGSLKYGESDLIVKAFTERAGLRSYHLRGVLKSKKGKLRASQFLLLTQLEIVANHKDKGRLESLRDARVLTTYDTLHIDILKSSVVFFLAEVLRNAVKEEEANPALFHYLSTSLTWFDQHEKTVNFHLLFLLRLSRFLGFYPDDSDSEKEYFNLLDGSFQDLKTNAYCIRAENLSLLKQFLGIDFDALSSIKLNKHQRSGFLVMLMEYYALHLQGFQKPKSLAVLNELFD